MNIGVARPGPDELAAVPHHFIASHSIQEEITAASFEEYALAKTEELFRQHDVLVMVGGTGLYIKAFTEGLDLIPEIPASIRETIVAGYKQNGIEWLQSNLREKDRLYAEQGEMKNPQRMMRALEVIDGTGQSILSYHSQLRKSREFNIVKIGIELPRQELVSRITKRVDQMMDQDLLNEVKSLLPFKNLNALQTVGYAELFDHLEGKLSLDEAIERIKINTRQYAKRQMTWFKKDPGYKWFSPDDLSGISSYIRSQLAKK